MANKIFGFVNSAVCMVAYSTAFVLGFLRTLLSGKIVKNRTL